MRKIYFIILVVLFTISITFVSECTDLENLQEKKNEIQTQIDENNNNLSNVNEELTQNLQQIQKLDENIQNTENTIEELSKNILSLEQEISKMESELKNITDRYNKQKKSLDTRLIEMYESPKTTYLDVVLNSKSISDFISTYYLIAEITSYDMNLLEVVDSEKKQIEEKSNIMNTQKNKLEEEKRKGQRTEIALSNTKLLRENLTSKLTEEEKRIQLQIDEYNNQINQIEAEIRSLAATINFGEDYKGGAMQWPIYGHNTITSNYGMRVHPITGVYKLHTGVDIGARLGDDFTAIANGIVVKAEFNRAYGNMVIIDHGGGVQTLYAHGSEIIAVLGQEVKAGDVVLKVGSTGYSTGPHAHFEVRVNGTPVNPLDYVSIPE